MNEYNEVVDDSSDEELQAELEACRVYNDTFMKTVVLTDPFDQTAEDAFNKTYNERLNIMGNGIMGYIEIPAISVELTIYHGTSAEVFDKGVGHMEKTSLPVGGLGTHAVLAAHTAYAKATMFNDLDELTEGDMFYITVLNEKLAYEVDQIKVVEPNDTSDLSIDGNEDYVTLVTCTPYGVNSHRLLVRGTRVPYVEEPEAEKPLEVLSWLLLLLPVGAVGLLSFWGIKIYKKHK